MTTHNKMTGQDIHSPISFVFADETARLVTTNPNTGEAYTTDDIGKEAWQTDDDSFYCLTSVTPAWVVKGGSQIVDTLYNSDQTMSAIDRVVDWTNDGSYDLTTYDVTTSDWTKSSGITADPSTGVSLNYLTGDGSGSTTTTNSIAVASAMTVTDGENSKGLVYAADYSDNYTDRSLVDKAYVDANDGADTIYNADGSINTEDRTVSIEDGHKLYLSAYDTDSSNYTGLSKLYLNGISTTLSHAVGDGAGSYDSISYFNVSSVQMLVSDGNNGIGLIYADDYSDNYTTRSLVDKAYVDEASSTYSIYHNDGALTGNREVLLAELSLTFNTGTFFSTGDDVLSFLGGNDGTRSQPLMKIQQGFEINDFVNIAKDATMHWRYDGETTSTHSLKYNSSDDQFETDHYGFKHEVWNIDEYNWYFDSEAGTNKWTIYNADPDDSEAEIFSLEDGAMTLTSATSSVLTIEADTGNDVSTEAYNARIKLVQDGGAVSHWIQAEGDADTVANGTDANALLLRTSGNYPMQVVIADTYVHSFGKTGGLDIDGDVTADNIFSSNPSQIRTTTDITALTTAQQISLDGTTIDESGSEYTIDTANNRITFGNGDGSRVYEITYSAIFTTEVDGGDSRSTAVIRGLINGTNYAGAAAETYIREYQGGSSDSTDTGLAKTFLIQPAQNDYVSFTVLGLTDGTTLTPFNLGEFNAVIKRIA